MAGKYVQLEGELSVLDKAKELLAQPYKLVLVQQHELERIRKKISSNPADVAYTSRLFKHYIIDKLPKTYLYT